jgi:hypothetical protein
VAIEPHDVLGKSFDALHIESTGTTNVTSTGADAVSLQTTNSYILARGVGPVQFVNTFSGTSSTTTLTSYSIP